MDGQEYLDQISATTAPSSSSSKFDLKKILSSKLFRFIGAGILLFILLIIIGNIINSASNKGRTLAEQLELRLTNLTSMLNEESNDYLKDTNLRSYNTALIGVLSNTNTQLTNYLAEAGITTKNISADIQASEADYIEALKAELEEARLNGLYDRTYVNSISTEINLIIALEENIRERTSNQTLLDILDQSIANLTSILENYDNFHNS